MGRQLASQYGWKVGDKIPIIGVLYKRTDGRPWEFELAGVYKALSPNVDEVTLFFHDEYLEEALDAGAATGPPGISVFAVRKTAGADQLSIMSDIDALYANGPQKVQTTTEA